jgi:hypothetical protein
MGSDGMKCDGEINFAVTRTQCNGMQLQLQLQLQPRALYKIYADCVMHVVFHCYGI